MVNQEPTVISVHQDFRALRVPQALLGNQGTVDLPEQMVSLETLAVLAQQDLMVSRVRLEIPAREAQMEPQELQEHRDNPDQLVQPDRPDK